MTRSERAAQQLASLQRRQEALATQLGRAEARQQALLHRQQDRRRMVAGKIVDDAGLFAWSNADLQTVFQALSRLVDVSNPAAVIEALLHRREGKTPEEQEEEKSRAHVTAILSENSHRSEETARTHQRNTDQEEAKSGTVMRRYFTLGSHGIRHHEEAERA